MHDEPGPRFPRTTVPARVTGNKIVRFLIMTGINVMFVSVRWVSVSAWQKGQ
jgi:hypothetical protein